MTIPRERHPTRQRIANELKKGTPLSKYDIEARCFVSTRNANNYLKLMHEAGEIHISAYHQISGHGTPTRYWSYGFGEDAKKPRRKSQSQKAKAYRARHPEKCIESALAKREMRRMIKEQQIV